MSFLSRRKVLSVDGGDNKLARIAFSRITAGVLLDEERSRKEAHFPPEILLAMFNYLPWRFSTNWLDFGSPEPSSWNLTLVCRRWHGPAMEYLCRSVYINDFGVAERFYRALANQPLLRGLVKVLYLPDNAMRQGSEYLRLYARIINKIESLETLSGSFGYLTLDTWSGWNGPHRFIPVAPGNHARLSSLILTEQMTSKGDFLPQLLIFQHLRVLELTGFHFGTTVDPAKVEPLPLLEKIGIWGGTMLHQLDTWLLACPRLCAVKLTGFRISIPTPKIISSGKIRHLEIQHTREPGDAPVKWLSAATLETLELTSDVFTRLAQCLPTTLGVLRIWCVDDNVLDLPRIRPYTARQPSIGRLVFKFSEDNEIMMQIRPDFIHAGKMLGIPVTLEILRSSGT